MFKRVCMFVATTFLVAGSAFFGSAPEAKAYTTYVYHVSHPKTFSVRYHDVYKVNYVYRTHRIVHVNIVKPIHYVSVITRVHARTVVVWRTVNSYVSKVYPARHVYLNRTIYY
jgi:hypothetical protein